MTQVHISDFSGKRAHLIGIGGSSMSGLALMLQSMGIEVTGSDRAQSPTTRKLEGLGIPVRIGHAAENSVGADVVVYTAAIAQDNPELLAARQAGVPMLERAELLGQLSEGYDVSIAVSGTHGKTTTTAMIAQMLMEAGEDPTIHIGGVLDSIGGSVRVGKPGGVFLTEACEFKGSFLTLSPTLAVVLNIDWDHPDFFKDMAHTEYIFEKFAKRVPPNGLCLGNGDDPRVVALLSRLSCRTATFGLGADNDVRAEDYREDEQGMPSFTVVADGRAQCDVTLQVAGDFQAVDALAALAVAREMGLDMHGAAKALGHFTGARRRFEHTGTIQDVKLYHDYGHNPEEMRKVLSIARKQPHNRLWAVMQPHTYSRVKQLFRDYVHCTEDADIVLVTDIYAARETNPGDIHSTMLIGEMEKSGQEVHYTPTFDDTEAYLRAHWQAGDLVLTMGCGDINQLNDQIAQNEEKAKK